MLDYKSAKKRLDPVLTKTDLIYSETFSGNSGNEVYIKPENLQKTGSFKIRGAFNKISKLDETAKEKGIITASAGNHAQGVAFAASLQNIKATVCMPTTTPMIKVEGTLKYGAKVDLEGETFDQTNAYAIKTAEEDGLTFIPPFDDLDVIEGQGTVALEILENLPDCDYILVPVGGGGLISGVAEAAKSINPKIKIIGVEPYNAASMKESISQGKIVKLENTDTIADGTAVGQVGEYTFEMSKKYVDYRMTVTEDEILSAFITLLERHKLICEPSGALSLAASQKLDVSGKKVVCLVSGGNIDMSFISTLIRKGLAATGRLTKIKVELPNSPGKLSALLDLISSTKANVASIEHDTLATTSRYKSVQVNLILETNGRNHINKILEILEREGYKIIR